MVLERRYECWKSGLKGAERCGPLKTCKAEDCGLAKRTVEEKDVELQKIDGCCRYSEIRMLNNEDAEDSGNCGGPVLC